MKNIILVSAIVLLTGCASLDPVIDVEPQEVSVPIAIPCKAVVPDKPGFNFDKVTVDQDVFDKTKALLADRKLHIGYELELLTALNSCIN